MAITLSHGGPTVYRSPARSGQVLVGTIDGVVCLERETATGEVWCSDDGGEDWSEMVSGRAPISKGDHYAAFVTA